MRVGEIFGLQIRFRGSDISYLVYQNMFLKARSSELVKSNKIFTFFGSSKVCVCVLGGGCIKL